MSTFASVRAYLFVFCVDPIMIELVSLEGAAFVICHMITLAIGAVHPVGASLTLRSRWDRWLAIGVSSAATCKLTMGVPEVGFTALGAYGCLFGAVFVRMTPLPALPAKWDSNRLASKTDSNRLAGKVEAVPIKGTRSCSILRIPDLKVGLRHLRSPRGADKPRPAAQDNVFAEGTLPKHSLHHVRGDFNTIGTVWYVEELAVALQLREGHEPWHTKVSEDLRFVVESLNELTNFHGGGDTCYFNAVCLIHGYHYLCPYA
jgi:hypothetical protein